MRSGREALGPLVAGVVALGAGVAIRRGPVTGPGAFWLAWVWGLVVLAGLAGWGRIAERLAGSRRLGWGMRGALGMAVAVVAGGFLNLAGVISPSLVLVFVAAGAGAAAWKDRTPEPGRRPRRPWEPAFVVGVLLATGLGLLQYSGSVCGTIDTTNERPPFDVHDDAQAYLVFPEKMLATGSLGADPFEPRRVLSLGGQSFLQTLILAARPVRTLHLLDEGIALLVLAALVAGSGRRLRVEPRLCLAAVLLLLTRPHLLMRGNTSALLTGVTLLLAWFLLELDRTPGSARHPGQWILTALLAAAACTVKSTFIALAVPFFLVLTAADLWRREERRRALAEAAAVAGLIGLFVAPWMIASWLSSGTPLYPVLGKGFVGAASNHGVPGVTGDFTVRTVDVARALWRHTFVLWPVAVLLFFVPDWRRRRPVTALVLAVMAAASLYVLAGDPNLNRSLDRYVFPVAMTGLLGTVLAAFEGTASRSPKRLSLAAAAGLVVAGLVFVHDAGRTLRMGDQVLINVWHGLRGEAYASPGEREAMARLEAAVPPGATLLETLAKPFLLDFRRNRVLLLSLPGFSSPPPGLPLGKGPEAVARYLEAQGIRYIAYGGVRRLQDLLNLTEADIEARYPRSRMRWVMLRSHEAYRRIVLGLALSRKVLYLDGRRVVLDLRTRESALDPRLVPDRTGFFADNGWTNGHGVLDGLDWPVPGGATVLRLELAHAHPDWRHPETLGITIVADGHTLQPVATAPGLLRFSLPPGLHRIHRLEILSSTFVPRERGIGNDGRTLGVPVARLVLEPPTGSGDQAGREVEQPPADLHHPCTSRRVEDTPHAPPEPDPLDQSHGPSNTTTRRDIPPPGSPSGDDNATRTLKDSVPCSQGRSGNTARPRGNTIPCPCPSFPPRAPREIPHPSKQLLAELAGLAEEDRRRGHSFSFSPPRSVEHPSADKTVPSSFRGTKDRGGRTPVAPRTEPGLPAPLPTITKA